MMAVAVFDDALGPDWQNWSWGTDAELSNASPVREGAFSAAITHTEGWAGFYLSAPNGMATQPGDKLTFSLHGGDAAHVLRLHVIDASNNWLDAGALLPEANAWQEVELDLNEIGAPSVITGLVWQEYTGFAQSTYYLDDIEIVQGDPGTPGVGPAITIDPSTLLGSISPDIYGLNFADDALAADIGLPVERWGGNATTRYNYQLDVSNRASDWYFENIANDVADVGALPTGSSADQFVLNNQQRGADTLLTIGTIGWTPNSRDRSGGFGVGSYGEQQSVDPFDSRWGNGIRPDGSLVTGNDPTDTSVAVDQQFAAEWIEHLVSQFGTAAEGGVKYYALDNEPMLWNHTHRDVHPEPASYDEVLSKSLTYAAAIKNVDPSAQVMGPAVWGWTAYFFSALDASGVGAWWANPQDRNAHDGLPFLPWYLQSMADAEHQSGERLLDYLDIHYYPQTGGVALTTEGGSAAVQQQRLASTASLWDPLHVDDSWINETVQLIPRMQDWIDAYYPGTKLAITEYNFGGVEHISGAVAQADVLGIFGREGVDLATMWSPPDADDPAGFAFRMYRNYDGLLSPGSAFGETSVQASSADAAIVSAFASERASDGALTIMLINKSTQALETPLQLPEEFGDLHAEVYSYDRSDLSQIVRQNDVALANGETRLTLPGYSITLLEVPSVSTGNLAPTGSNDELTIERGSQVGFFFPGVLVNDADPENDVLSARVATPPSNGQILFSADGTFVYLPFGEFTGADSFTYVASDGHRESEPTTVTIGVEPVTAEHATAVADARDRAFAGLGRRGSWRKPLA